MNDRGALPPLKPRLCNTHGVIVAGRIHLPEHVRGVEVKCDFW